MVADHADIQLAPGDVFLGNRRLPEPFVDECHPLAKLLVVLDKRRLGNSVGPFLFQRLHKRRQGQAFRPAHLLPDVKDGKLRHADAVMAQDDLGNALVLAERQPDRTTPGKRQVEQFKKRRNVLVVLGVVLEAFDQVEHQVRPAEINLLLDQRGVVVHAEHLERVSQFADCFNHVRFRRPVRLFEFFLEGPLKRSRRRHIKNQQDLVFSPHGRCCPSLFRSLELAGKQVVHHQRGDVGHHLEIQRRFSRPHP